MFYTRCYVALFIMKKDTGLKDDYGTPIKDGDTIEWTYIKHGVMIKNDDGTDMKLETIIKVTPDGGIEIPSDMKVGSGLMNMVKELRDNGWRTFEHHDNWIKNENYPNPTFEQQFDTGNAYNEMLKTKN